MNNSAVICDIKTGKAEPWSRIQTAGYSLLDDFSVDFQEDGHAYTAEGVVVPSVTTVLAAEGFIDTTWYDDWSREKGSFIHKAIKYYLDGILDEQNLDPEIYPYLMAFRKFMQDSGFQVERAEVPGINKSYGFAGTPDLVGCFPRPTPVRRFALELTKEEKYKLIPHADKQDINIWLSALACFNWRKNHLRRKP